MSTAAWQLMGRIRPGARALMSGLAVFLCIPQQPTVGQIADDIVAHEQTIWSCAYIGATSQGPLAITAKFQVMGDELAEIETIPSNLNFKEKYKILEDTEFDIVAAISISKLSDNPPPGIGAVIVIIAKQNGLFQQSGSLLGVRTGAPTLGHCERQ